MKATRTVRTAALSRHQAPAFVLCAGLELIQLRKLSWLARSMFLELLAMADHVTGRVSTSYAVLGALLDFDQAPTAHQADGPTVQRLRTALDALVSMRLVFVDRVANEKRKGLFLRVPSRVGIGTASENSNRQSNRPAKAKKPEKSGTYAKPAKTEQQTEQQGVQEEILSPLPPELSTDRPIVVGTAVARLRAVRDGLARRGAGGEASPQGG